MLILAIGLLGAVPTEGQLRPSRPSSLKPRSLNGDTTLYMELSAGNMALTICNSCFSTTSSPLIIGVHTSDPASTTVNIYAYFASSSAALTGTTSGYTIPSSQVQGYAEGGQTPTYEPFTQTGALGTPGAGLFLNTGYPTSASPYPFTSPWLGVNLPSSVHLPADTYTGTLFFQAQAF